MTYTDDTFQPEPDVLHEVIREDGTVIFESFDKDEAEQYLKNFVYTFGSIAKVKSTPV